MKLEDYNKHLIDLILCYAIDHGAYISIDDIFSRCIFDSKETDEGKELYISSWNIPDLEEPCKDTLMSYELSEVHHVHEFYKVLRELPIVPSFSVEQMAHIACFKTSIADFALIHCNDDNGLYRWHKEKEWVPLKPREEQPDKEKVE